MKRFLLVIIAMLSALGLYSFKYNASSADEVKTSYISFYHDKFNGRKTASGEVFSNSKLTAAHRILPFGTKVRLTNPKNEKSVVVTINDRGPFHSSRVMDVSRAAYVAIGNAASGSMPVEYSVVQE